jgi:hypothetical protein
VNWKWIALAALSNAKHEAFAYNRAKGLPVGEAYVHAGYSHNPASASRVHRLPAVQDRIKELKKEMLERVNELVTTPNEETAIGLRDMGLSIDWCARQYKEIANEARDSGQYTAAISAVSNIQKLIEIETSKRGDKEEAPEAVISVKDTIAMLKEMKSLMNSPVQEMVDITPND